MTTVFLSGGTGFIGEAFARVIVGAGHRLQVLTRSQKGAELVRALGGEPVLGDLLVKGPWQATAAAAEELVHLAQPKTFGGRVSQGRAEEYRQSRLLMDRNLLGHLDAAKVRRILYVGGTSYYGSLGTVPRDEHATPAPRGWGPYLAPAIEAIGRDLDRGLPIVTAFPGHVYGDRSWFRSYVIKPIRRGWPLYTLAGRSRYCSPVHVRDCARGLGHLLLHGEVGKRYFVVDDRPSPWTTLFAEAARALGRPLRLHRIPALLLRLLAGTVITDSLLSDSSFSNGRLKALGWKLEFPTIEAGIPEVVANLRP